MTEKTKKRRKLAHEILLLFAICFFVTLALYFFLAVFGGVIAEEYCWEYGIEIDDDVSYHIDGVVFNVSLAVSVAFFTVLFLTLLGERLAYILTIIKGVDALRRGELAHRLPIEGNNELTQLAEAINYLSETEQAIKEKERRLREEREELIRTLSHDIRTPLTSIISYTEIASAKGACTPAEQREYFELIGKKALQIKDITALLLDGGKRKTEHFENARLLFEQLAYEFEDVLEEAFRLEIDLSGCGSFSGDFDVQEMRRVFDNLISNVQKYAEPGEAVLLCLLKNDAGVVIRQKNTVKKSTERAEGYRMGLYSIRRIAHNYGGRVDINQDDEIFEITITLSDIQGLLEKGGI